MTQCAKLITTCGKMVLGLVMTGALLAFGCERKGLGTYSETDIAEHLNPGTTMRDVESAFGRPRLLRATKDGKKMVIYEKPSREMPSSYQGKLSGFIIYYTNDVLEYWTPTYSDQTIVSPSAQRPSTSSGETNRSSLDARKVSETVSLYVMNSQGDEAIQSKAILRRAPDLQFAGVEQVSRVVFRGGESNQQYDVAVVLGKTDSEALRSLTAENLGSRLVIAVGEDIVASSYLIAPIDNGSFSFPCGTEEERDAVFAKLQKFSAIPE